MSVCLAVDERGEIVVPLRWVSGPERTISRIRCILTTEIGTWLDDARAGIPVLEWLASPRRARVEIEAVLRAQLQRLAEGIDVLSVRVAAVGGGRWRVDIAARIVPRDGSGATTMQITGSDAANAPAGGAWYVLLVRSA